MHPSLAADITAILERAVLEYGFAIAVLFDREGETLAEAGEAAALPAAAQALISHDSFRRVALALDEDEPELAPDPGTSGGALFFFGRAERYVVGVATQSDDRTAFEQHADTTVHRIDGFLDARRRERRKRFLGHRLIARVCDKTFVMSAEVRTQLEHLCDLLLDLEEAHSGGRHTGELGRLFHEALSELIARPKKSGGSFQHNLEILADSVCDLDGSSDLSEERLRAIIAGLEVSVESWPLP